MSLEVVPHGYTHHGKDQAYERLSLRLNEILQILDENKYVLIGTEGEKRHQLFYSRPDDAYYVAVVNEYNEIVTILPITMHGRIRIDFNACLMAKKLILGEAPRRFTPAFITDSITPCDRLGLPRYSPSALHIWATLGGKMEQVKLGSLSLPAELVEAPPEDRVPRMFNEYPAINYLTRLMHDRGKLWSQCHLLQASHVSLAGYRERKKSKKITVAERKSHGLQYALDNRTLFV